MLRDSRKCSCRQKGNLANSRRFFTFLQIFGHSMALFGVRRGFKMILSHRALTSLNMSSYRAIWTHFRVNLIFCWPQKLRLPKIQTFPKMQISSSSHSCGPSGPKPEIWDLKHQKNKNSQNQNPFCPECRQYFSMPEKGVPAPFGALPAHFLRGPEKSKNCTNSAYFPWWALCIRT